jgi:hypothetical protein
MVSLVAKVVDGVGGLKGINYTSFTSMHTLPFAFVVCSNNIGTHGRDRRECVVPPP